MSGIKMMGIAMILVAGVGQSHGTVILGSDLHDGFYGEEPPFQVDRGSWLGLVADGEGHALAPATLEWNRLEVAPGAEGPHFSLIADLDSPLFLASDVAGLAAGPVRGASPTSTRLSPGAPPVQLESGGSRYVLHLESAYPDECTAEVVISRDDVEQRVPVTGVLGCGDPHFTIHWAGDLDGDAALDFLATFSMKYSYHPRQLFLSTVAGPGELVGLAVLTDRSAS